MNRYQIAKQIVLIALALLMFFTCSCSKQPDETVTDPTTGSVTIPPSIAEEEEPAVDYNEGFLSLVEALTPVAAWNCEPNENHGNQIVDAVSGNAATLVGASVTEGYSGGGIETLAQKGSYLDVGTGTLGAALNGKSAVTVSMWIMPYVMYNSTNYRLISLPIDGGKGGFQLHYQSVSVKIGGRSVATENFASKTYAYQMENKVLGTMADYSNEGQWQHIVATLDFENDNVILYVNGSKLVTEGVTAFVSNTYQMGTPTEADCFGGSPRSDVYSFNGIMDNIFVFDRVLNAKEVRQLYTQPGVNNSPIIDELLLQSIIKRMGQEPAFSAGCSNLLCGGMVCPVDENDLTATPILQNGEFLIPVGTASKYFAVTNTVSAVTVQGKSYQSLQQLCQANGKSLLEYQNMAVIMSASDTFQANADKTLLDRLVTFFTEPAATTVFTATELSRTVIAKTGDLGTIGHCASPSILSVGGTLYASMDSNAKEVYVFASTDGGESFSFLSKINNFKFATLFSLNGDLYLLGVEVDGSKRYAAITKSTDGGKTWSEITAQQGRLPQSSDGHAAHSTSTAVLIANGRVYKAYSGQAYNGTSFSWRKGCTAYVESAPVNANLLDPSVWTVSSPVSFDTATYLAHPNASDIPTYVYCQEGNVVLAPDGSVWAIYRVDCVPAQGYAIIMKLSADNQTLTYSRTASDSMIHFEGGITKCTVRYDAATGKYLALVNNVTDDRFYAQRNVLSIAVSDDMVNWTIAETILIDRSVMNDYISMTRHGFQYVDWVIDGEDILFAVREAMGESENYHNANNLTFYRLSDYKELLK
ncbi:MAG: hypothetical protein IJW55_09605 [Clostridia bacterium]|nr:hypothetical protein [Clostridia bacterium]